jgi:thiamine kinase-like enzyme
MLESISNDTGRVANGMCLQLKSGLVANFMVEGLSLCHCDLHLENFRVSLDDPCGDIYLIDFEHASWLPRSFLAYELLKRGLSYQNERLWSKARVERPPHENLASVGRLDVARSRGMTIE